MARSYMIPSSEFGSLSLAPLDSRIPVYELVEPASEASPVSNFLKKRGGLHHVCYEIDDLEEGCARRGVPVW